MRVFNSSSTSKITGMALLIVIGLLVGWVMNIVTIVSMMSGELGAEIIVRCIGIFVFPIGAVLGFYNI